MNSPNSRFQVVPPNQIQPQPQTPPPVATPPQENSQIQPSQPTPTPAKSKSFPTGWIIFAGIVIAVGAISQIKVSPSVRAEAWLNTAPSARRVIHTEIPGTIEEVLVEVNDEIEVGDAIALIESQQLEEKIDQGSVAVEEAGMSQATAFQQVSTAEMRLTQAQNQLDFSQQRVGQLQAEINQMEAGILPSHISGYQTKIVNLEGAIASLDDTIANIAPLVKEGAIAGERLNETQRQKLTLQGQIGEIQAAMEMAKRRLYDDLALKLDEMNRLQTAVLVAQQEVESAKVLFQRRQPVTKQVIDNQKKILTRHKQNTVLRSPIAGTVVTPDLYLLQGKTLPEGEAILEVADTSQLVAVIEVRQEDRDLIQAGAIVKFNPPEPGLPSFTTEIKDIISVLERNEQLGKSTVRVIADIDTTNKNLQPEAKVYARIESPRKIPLYEQARRELLNLFKVRKYS
ncbi:MAG: HlyD family efflux transporter periplasmic adaptor subunit [Jaaginema sp. PMC 1079.18]|nr:HlyD family efflux transporter periplasmic adaptor subunit [Jaaginema sp. PMC 1080.18]MEC4852690.1 HlyD family efflux transporter periplasmic adaptor subunit [Jaaginema sp. PMC 1079.18]MEC4867236.1 HlyD family efflux transporter periplasmic adaptor subunit [Jaaginema sp. PMC 1078.18]